MRNLYLSIFITAFGLTSFGQTYSTVFEAQTVISQRLISLNGGLRSQVDGKSRTIIPVNLPKETISWYYTFSTGSAGSGVKNLQLLMQVSALIADPTKVTSFALSNIKIPSGSHTVDVYLLDQPNADAFFNKIDNKGGTFYYNREGTVTATKEGTVRINQISNSQMYLGIKNPSSLDGVDVSIEVVAIVAVEIYEDRWTLDNLNKIYYNCLGTFSIRNIEIEQICNCVKEKIFNNYVPSAYYQLSEPSRNKLHKDEISNCTIETENTSVIDKDKKIKELYEQHRGQSITKDYKAQEETLIELIRNGINHWNIYNSLGFVQLCLKKYEAAKKSLQMGLGKNPTNLYLLGNLGNYYLLTEQYEQAITIFKEYKNKKIDGKMKFKKAVSEDLKEFERLGLGNPYFERVRKKLKIE